MASFSAGTTFTDGVANDVTAAKLGALVNNATPTSGLIQDRTAETSTAASDTLLIGDSSDSNALKRITVANFAQTLPTAKITTGTIETGTFGTTTSTAATITSGTITNLASTTGTIATLDSTNGTIATLNSTTGTIGALNSTTGTIGTINSTTGTIGDLSATTSTFLGTITGSTNVINIGSGQIYKDASGNVGIGTASPNSKLVVTSGASPNRSQIIIGSTGLSENYYDSNTHYFRNGSQPASEKMRIDSSGNVGIGVAAPVNKLEVVGSFGRGAPVTKTADFTLADTENWLIVNKGSSCTVTLPAASSWTGREFTIKVITAHAVVSATSNIIPRIGGAAATAILPATDGAWATLVSNGSNWEIMCGS